MIGLHRHRGSELAGSSVSHLFSRLQAAVEREHEVRPRPWHWRHLPEARRREVTARWMAECDLVIAPDDVALEARRAAGLDVPVVSFPLGSLPRGDSAVRRQLPLLRSQDVIACTSEADLAILRLLYDSCAAAQALLPLGVETRAFRPPSPEEREEVRRSLGIRRQEVLFLSLGRITAEKSVHEVLELFATVVRRHPRARLAIAGPFADLPFEEFGTGPFDLRVVFDQILAARPEVRARTLLLGNVLPANAPSLYGAADVFINLTRHHDENFGYAQVEAMACGLPVIGTDWGGLKDTIRHGETGWKVPTWVTGRGIQIDLFRAFRHCDALIRSPALRRRMGEAGRAVAEAEYSAERFERSVLELVARALDAPRGRPSRTALSAFGRRFSRAFGGRRPVPARFTTPGTYPLYQELILPYATGPVEPRPAPDGAVLFSTPLSCALEGDRLTVEDVVWPVELRLSDAERALLVWYRRQAPRRGRFIPVGEARRALPGRRFDQTLAALVRKGILLTSPDRA